MNLSFNYSDKPEKAPTLWNSFGTAKTRLHFHNDYTVNEDKYAVYAKKITLKEGEVIPKNTWRFVYYKVPNDVNGTVYKINKSSLQKRLGISSAELDNVTNNDYSKLIEQKLIDNKVIKATQRILSGETKPTGTRDDKTVIKNEWESIRYGDDGYSGLIYLMDRLYSYHSNNIFIPFVNSVDLASERNDPDLFKKIPKNGMEFLIKQQNFYDRLCSLNERAQKLKDHINKLEPEAQKEFNEMCNNLSMINDPLKDMCSLFKTVLNHKDFKTLTEGTPPKDIQPLIKSWVKTWNSYYNKYNFLRPRVSNIKVSINA